MTRGLPEEDGTSGTRRTRAIRVTNPLPSDVDEDIFKRGRAPSTAVPNLFQYNGAASHVLLAACAANELAIEEEGRGAFTRAFLDTITKIGYRNLTYADVIRRLPRLNRQAYFSITTLTASNTTILDNPHGVREITVTASSSTLNLPVETVTSSKSIWRAATS
jgi:hypothetical protein